MVCMEVAVLVRFELVLVPIMLSLAMHGLGHAYTVPIANRITSSR